MNKLSVALVGLGFGGAFINIYQSHPNVLELSLCDADETLLRDAARLHNIRKTYNNLEDALADDSVDAVHLVTPIPLHERQTLAVLSAGKHCACTVPMAVSLDGIRRITEAVRKSRKNYMCMETTLYTYQFFYVKEMLKSGQFGRIQFMRGTHYQDMANWPKYWEGLPPMHYGTHAIGPMVALSGSRIKRVNCFGSGTMDKKLTEQYGNPFPIECALFEFENGMKAEATRSLYETARVYQEGLSVYGSEASFEWGFSDGDAPYVTRLARSEDGKRGRASSVECVDLPNYHERLPEEIQKYTVGKNFDPLNPHLSLKKGSGGGHHGSHPHLVHEFVMSIIENRKPYIDETLGGNITASGVCAHISAMNEGMAVEVPVF